MVPLTDSNGQRPIRCCAADPAVSLWHQRVMSGQEGANAESINMQKSDG